MVKLFLLLVLPYAIFALDINNKVTFQELLSHSEIYIDQTKSLTIDNIQNVKFKPNTHKVLSYGYSPHFNVWIKFNLKNKNNNTLHRIIEYDNPLTSYIKLYKPQKNILPLKDGLLSTPKERISIHPSFHITLSANESYIYYMKVYSDVTPLIIKLNIWDKDTFYKKELHYQIFLALFFGAMGIIFLYNFIIYLSIREQSYLYYVLSFVGILVYYLLYKGIANLYIIPMEYMENIIKFSSFIVAFPVFFLALFTREILTLKQYKVVYSLLNYTLIIFPLLILFVYFYDLNQYRSLFPILLLFMLVCITLYALIKHNRQAMFLMVGWLVFFSSGFFMFLSSHGIYDIFSLYPHYMEFSLIVEAITFSLSLADKIKQLQKEKLTVQSHFITYQEEETTRLTNIVEVKTYDLKKSLDEKKLLLKELNHRVKNSMQTIISFLRLQRYNSIDEDTQNILQNLENKVFAINDLYALLHTSDNVSTVDTYSYFSLLIENVRKSFHKPNISIHLDSNLTMPSDDAVYCGFILNEAITNCYQHAFTQQDTGEIFISLTLTEERYHLHISDNGCGYTHPKKENDTLGMLIIDTLVTDQLNGEISISHITQGVQIDIMWGKYE